MPSTADDAEPTIPEARRRPSRADRHRSRHAGHGARANSSGRGRVLTGATEGALLGALLAAPWAYGGAPEWARYALAALLLCALTPWALARARRGDAWPPLAPRAAGLPLLALAQIGLGLSAAPTATADAALLLVAFLGVAVFWSERAREHRSAAQRLAVAVLSVATAQGVFGAVQQALTPGRIYGHATPLVTNPFGSYVNHNHFAGLAAMAALLAAGWAWGQARRAAAPTPGAVALGGLALGLCATLLASRSRGGLVALGCGLVSLVLLRACAARLRNDGASIRALALGAALALLAGVGAALGLVPESTRAHLLGTFTGAAAEDTSSAYRVDTARATLRLVAHHPLLGAGFGAFADALTPYKMTHGELRTAHAESDLLELLAEGGLAGFAVCGVVAAFAWRRLRERLEHGRDATHTGLVEGAAAALVALGAHSLFDFNLRLPANALVAAALLGIVSAGRARGHGMPASSDDVAHTGSASRAARATAWLAALLSLGLAAAAGWRAHGAWALERALALPAPQRLGALDDVTLAHPRLAEAWRARGLAWRDLARPGSSVRVMRLARAERDFASAVRLRPNWAEAWADLGWTRFARGDVRTGRADLDRALRLDPTHVGIGVARAALYAQSGDVTEGVRQLARTLESNPAWGAHTAVELALTWTAEPAVLAPLIGDDPVRRDLLEQGLARRRVRSGSSPK